YDLFAAVEIMKEDAAEELLAELKRVTRKPWAMLLSKEPAGEYIYKEYFAFFYRQDRVTPAEVPGQFCSTSKARLAEASSCYADDLRLDNGRPDFEREPFIGHFEKEGHLITVAA